MIYSFDVVVIGAGHAGVEAAAAAARMGALTALVSLSHDNIGVMSCNPAIGGLGKGHLVREIDALDGVMALAADLGGIQFRILNRKKGPAVRGPRAQADRKLYAGAVRSLISRYGSNLVQVEGEVTELSCDDGSVNGVVLSDGRRLRCSACVVTTGTFLNGRVHIGSSKFSAGRIDEAPSISLAAGLRDLGLVMGRLKTGTPARIYSDTIQWDSLDFQEGDTPPEPFSDLTESIVNPQIKCGITRTTADTHQIIRDNLHRAPMYSGEISGRGPRYCPSIEDKVVRFSDRDSHQVFLEPEGLDSELVYPNGISTSLPEDVQEAFIKSMPGLQNARIARPGYAVEYDFVDPRQLDASLSVIGKRGLYLAGQINGTTGYEEAAAQGLVAGINAARCSGGLSKVTFDRSQSYIGVLIDDLVTNGVTEPYRMFTSRAEFRLSLRCDNADERLTPTGIQIGCVGKVRSEVFERKTHALDAARASLTELTFTPNEAVSLGIHVNRDGVRRTALELLSRTDCTFDGLSAVYPALKQVSVMIQERLKTDATYAVYLNRQKTEVLSFRKNELFAIPDNFDYGIPGLSTELQVKLRDVKPSSLGQAARIEGITPAALTLLAAMVRRSAKGGLPV